MRRPSVCEAHVSSHVGQQHARSGSAQAPMTRCTALVLLALLPSATLAQDGNGCISLKGSETCAAFDSASISTNNALIRTYPFLQFVSDTASFDSQLAEYVQTALVRDRYQNIFGCGDINYTDASNMYARYTTTVLCNTLVQQSIGVCSLSREASRPVCADTCAEFARSEAYITADSELCSNPSPDLNKLIRADFTTCSLPDASLSDRCISGVDNEPDNCGFANSSIGLCSYCAAGGINSTDTCCYNANAERRCQGVRLPSITPTMTFSTPAPTSTATDGPSGDGGGGRHLSGGAIAGIVIGTLAGVALLALLLFLCVKMLRRRRGSQQGSVFNQPSPARRGGPVMSQPRSSPPDGYEVLPGGRVARLTALESHPGDSPPQRNNNLTGAAAGAAAGYAAARSRSAGAGSSSDGYGDSPESRSRGVNRAPATARRQGSLSSGSLLAGDGSQYPASGGEHSSPLGMASQTSEQLPFFKDYYSQDDIHPSDRVAVLWAYQPRAPDEFALERGDMLKVAGIWDDGWATGVMLDERAEEWEARRQAQRDSGVSNTVEKRRSSPPSSSREMKAFPLVCVCLPDHWKRTIDGDGSTETTSTGPANPGAHNH
ncbi:hypothetical protein CDD82_5412 [Ophiocordyceps australis]|uniref:SH3 domain-containing protein n=1 Tax=Ophiocordyceps australis TaxID=1399860 RepID=A0A2C5ZW14_9HYPO|nr:hypothetical protein CDD82_5412 [Ophiocordyceps australis]